MRLVGLVLAVCAASRLPMVFFPEMPLTGDECVVGLMGKHLGAGRGLSLYFSGQHYGLSVVEAAAAAALYPLLGVTATAVRLGMLGLLVMALRLLYAALARMAGTGAAVVGVLLFAALPPWTLWSIQARGGYLTALLATCAVLSGVSALEQRPSCRGWAAIAGAAAVAVLAQMSWLPALLPILLLVPLRTRNLRLAVGLLAAVLCLGAAGHLAGAALTRDYWPSPSISLARIPGNLRLLPRLLGYHFTTDLFSPAPENPIYRVCGWAWLAGLPAGLGIQAWRLAARKHHPWAHALCLSTLASLGALMTVPLLPRYLLSVSFFLTVWLSVEAAALARGWRPVLPAGLLIFLGFTGLAVDRAVFPMDGPDEGDVLELVGLLGDEGIRRAYTTDALLQWMVMFYRNETILCRWQDAGDRIPALPREVDRALYAGEPVAIIGMMGSLGTLADPDSGLAVYAFPDLPFFIAPHPTPAVLERNGFRLNPLPAGSPR